MPKTKGSVKTLLILQFFLSSADICTVLLITAITRIWPLSPLSWGRFWLGLGVERLKPIKHRPPLSVKTAKLSTALVTNVPSRIWLRAGLSVRKMKWRWEFSTESSLTTRQLIHIVYAVVFRIWICHWTMKIWYDPWNGLLHPRNKNW